MPKSISLTLPSEVDHDIRRLQVTEDDRRLLAMEILQHVTQLIRPLQRTRFGNRPLASDDVFEVGPAHEFHHQVVIPLGLETVVDVWNARMPQALQDVRLRFETFHRLVAFVWIGEPIQHLFDGTDVSIITERPKDCSLSALFDNVRDVVVPCSAFQDNLVTTLLTVLDVTRVRCVTLGAENLLDISVSHRQTFTDCERLHLAR